MNPRGNTSNGRIGKRLLRCRTRLLLAGVSLLALAATPAVAEDWQQRLRAIESGAAPGFDLGSIQLVQATAAEARRFDIPSGDLQAALLAFSQAADLQLLYPAEMTAGLTTRGVQGEYTPAEALRRLLAGTGLNYRFSDTSTVTLAKAGAPDGDGPLRLDPITVTGAGGSAFAPVEGYRATHSYTATKTDTPILDIPASIQVVPEQVIEDQQIVGLKGVVKNVSGIQYARGAGVDGDQLTARGFNLARSGTVFRDGVRESLFNSRFFNLTNIDRVEVLKGPATVLFGRSEPGAVVNLVTKKPRREYHHSAQQQVGSFDFFRTTVDSTGPIPGAPDLQYRLIASYQDSESFRDFVETDVTFINPQIAWDITDRARVRAWFEYLEDERTQDLGLPAIGDEVADVSDDTFIGSPSDFLRHETLRAGLDLSYEFVSDWTFRGAFDYENDNRADVRTRPRFGADAVNEASGEIKREFADNQFDHAETFFLTANIEGDFETGPVDHTLLLGIDYRENDLPFKLVAFEGQPLFGQDTESINLFNPVPTVFAPDPRALPTTGTSRVTDDWVGLYWQNQIVLFDGRVHLLLGGRYDDAEADFRAGDFFQENKVSEYTQRYGIVLKPRSWLSVYGSYTESVSGEFVFNTRPGGETLDPETAEQWEVGAKALFFDDRLFVTLAGFQLTKQNIAVPDPNDPGFSVPLGEAQSRGLEVDIAGEIAPGWNVLASYAWLPQAEITEDTRTGNEGNRLFNAPRHSGNLWLTYTLQGGRLQDLTLGAGVFGASEREGDNANTFEADGYVRVDAMVRYPLTLGGARAIAQLNIENLFDTDYIQNTSNSRSSGNRPGAPLTVLGLFKVEF